MATTLATMTRGDHSPPYVFTLTRATPPLDLTTATAIKFMARKKGSSSLLFTKTIGDGVTADSASQITVQLVPADTSGLADNKQNADTLECEIEVTEVDSRVTTPWFGTLTVRHDLG